MVGNPLLSPAGSSQAMHTLTLRFAGPQQQMDRQQKDHRHPCKDGCHGGLRNGWGLITAPTPSELPAHLSAGENPGRPIRLLACEY